MSVPREPGWYWVRRRKEDPWEVVRLAADMRVHATQPPCDDGGPESEYANWFQVWGPRVYLPDGPVTKEAEQRLSFEEAKRQAILRALEYTRGNKRDASRLLGIGKTTLYRWIDELGIREAG
jgi:transcriptional regulator with GAF, ATPase, and Fis domain